MLTGPQILEAIEVLRDSKEFYTESRYWDVYFLLRSEFYKSKEWIQLSKEIRTEIPFCERCDKKKKILHAHHIKRLYTHTYLGLQKANLEVLCIPCHYEEHNQKAA